MRTNRADEGHLPSMTAPTSDQHPANYDASKYPLVFVTVDLAIFTIRNGALSILMIERADEPFRGHLALPGGFINPDEDAETAAWRELAEETGVDRAAFNTSGHLEQLKTYSAPDRDPRHRIVSIAHVAFAPNLPTPTAGSDARHARWWAIEDLLDAEDSPALAFDHAEILADAVERVRSKLEYTTLATQFVDEPFTISDLHRVYAAVWDVAPEPNNFRRKVTNADGFVERVEGRTVPSVEGGRPAALYRRGSARAIQPPMMRP